MSCDFTHVHTGTFWQTQGREDSLKLILWWVSDTATETAWSGVFLPGRVSGSPGCLGSALQPGSARRASPHRWCSVPASTPVGPRSSQSPPGCARPHSWDTSPSGGPRSLWGGPGTQRPECVRFRGFRFFRMLKEQLCEEPQTLQKRHQQQKERKPQFHSVVTEMREVLLELYNDQLLNFKTGLDELLTQFYTS